MTNFEFKDFLGNVKIRTALVQIMSSIWGVAWKNNLKLDVPMSAFWMGDSKII